MDRDIIARHLLSDATDPFNRSKLTLDMLKTDHALKVRCPRRSGLHSVHISQDQTSIAQARIVAWKQQKSGGAKPQLDDPAPSDAPADSGV